MSFAFRALFPLSISIFQGCCKYKKVNLLKHLVEFQHKLPINVFPVNLFCLFKQAMVNFCCLQSQNLTQYMPTGLLRSPPPLAHADINDAFGCHPIAAASAVRVYGLRCHCFYWDQSYLEW